YRVPRGVPGGADLAPYRSGQTAHVPRALCAGDLHVGSSQLPGVAGTDGLVQLDADGGLDGDRFRHLFRIWLPPQPAALRSYSGVGFRTQRYVLKETRIGFRYARQAVVSNGVK